jgi:VWFA-related protein
MLSSTETPEVRVRRLAPLLALLALASRVTAQTFRERVDVDVVRVELLALDGKGQPVGGLKASDFTVLVDGRPVKTDGFEGPRPAALPAPRAPAPLPLLPVPVPRAAAEAPPAAAAPPPAPAQSYFMAVLVDELSSEQSNRQATLREVFQFLQKDLPPDVQVLLMRFNGTLRVECPWTADVERLRRAAAAISKHQAAPLVGDPRLVSSTTEHASFLLEFDTVEALMHVRTSLAGLFDALRIFPEVPGRKALYFVSDGTPFLTPSEIAKNLIATAPLPDPLVPRSPVDYDRDLLVDSLAWDRTRTKSLLTDIARLALLRGVEIHPVMSAPHDASGRMRTDRSFSNRATQNAGRPVDRGSAPLGAKSLQRGVEVPPATDISAGQSMEAVAEATGGEAVLSRRMFQDALRREVENRDAAYLLSFRDPFAGDHLFHKIEVSSSKSGLSLRYRRGYRVLDTREALVQRATNRLHLPADDNPLGVRLQLDDLGQQKGLATAQITVAYPATPEAGDQVGEPGAIQIIGICAVRDGKLSEPIDLGGKADRVQFGDVTWLVRTGQVRLKPGGYRWSFAIRDEQTGITSYLTFDRRLP